MHKFTAVFLTLITLFLLTACGEEEEQASSRPTFQSINVEGRDPVENGEQQPYTVAKNGDVSLEMEFSNPDDVEFNTVQINETTYRAHRFSEDSDSENLILDLSAGRIPGETEYEVEEIEYTDEEGVKSIEVDEDNVYTLFVMRSTPEATFEDIDTSSDSLAFELDIDDPDDTLRDARLEIVHEEEGVVDHVDVATDAGVMNHEFDRLFSDTAYSLRLTASYETDSPEASGDIVEDEVIGESSDIETEALEEPTIDIENTSVDETNFTFDLERLDPDEVMENDALTLRVLQGDDEVSEQDVGFDELNDIQLDGLLNNNTYTIEIHGDYDLDDGEGPREDALLATEEFTTKKKELPEITTDTEDVTEDSLEIDIDAEDFYDTVEVEHMTVYVYDGEVEDSEFDPEADEHIKKVELSRSSKFKLNGLHADQDLTVFVVPSYDLGDSEEKDFRTDKVYSSVINTPSNESPEMSIDEVNADGAATEVILDIEDPDETIVADSYTYRLIEHDEDNGKTEVEQVENSNETTETLDYEMASDKSYTVEVDLEYDLRDEEGANALEASYTIATVE